MEASAATEAYSLLTYSDEKPLDTEKWFDEFLTAALR